MTAVDELGYLAASLVLATFCAKRMVPLRAIAIASNVAFVAYAFSAGLGPILLLHAILLPVNILRLREALGAGGQPVVDGDPVGLDHANRRGPSAMEEQMIAAIQSAFRFGRRSLALFRRRVALEDKRLIDLQRDGAGAWHFF
jgi:hypothetical protein